MKIDYPVAILLAVTAVCMTLLGVKYPDKILPSLIPAFTAIVAALRGPLVEKVTPDA